jgi:TIR domain
MPQVSCGATPAPSLARRVGMWDDPRSGLESSSAGFPGGVQRGVSGIHFLICTRHSGRQEARPELVPTEHPTRARLRAGTHFRANLLRYVPISANDCTGPCESSATTMGYSYDVFISYRRRNVWTTWINKHFKPLLSHYLSEELPDDVHIYKDDLVDEGTDWPKSLAKELARSRIIVPLISRSYFRSAWCAAELGHMIWREEMSLPKSKHPGRLIAPVIIHDGTGHLPKDVSKIQYLEMQKYALHNLQEGTSLASEMEQMIQDWAPAVAACIRRAPRWTKRWEEPLEKSFLELFYRPEFPHQPLPSWSAK